MITFVKTASEKDTILDKVVSESSFTIFVRLIGWAIKSGNPCWAECGGADVHVAAIVRNMSYEEQSEVKKILAPLPFYINGSQFRDGVDTIRDDYDEEIFNALFGADKRFRFRDANHLHDNAVMVFKALRENLSGDGMAINIIDDIQKEIGLRGFD